MHDCGKIEGQVAKLQEERDAALLRVKAEHSDSLQHHHAWMCEMELRRDREEKLAAANLQLDGLKEQYGELRRGNEAVLKQAAEWERQIDELREHLRYVCVIARRLGPKASESEVHREEALALLEGTLRDAENVWRKTEKQKPECTCSIDGTPYCKAKGTGYCNAEKRIQEHPNCNCGGFSKTPPAHRHDCNVTFTRITGQ